MVYSHTFSLKKPVSAVRVEHRLEVDQYLPLNYRKPYLVRSANEVKINRNEVNSEVREKQTRARGQESTNGFV